MAGNASILIQEQNSGKRTNFLVFELDGCGQKTGKSRLVSCPVVVRKKDDFVYIIPFDDNMKVISEQYQFINYHHKADQENSRRGLVRGLRMYNCFKSIYGIEGDVLTTDMVDMLVAFLFGYSYSPSGENDLTTRDPATINAYLASIRQYLKYIGKPCNHLDAQELVSVVSEYDGLTTTVQRKQYKIRAKEDPHKHDYAPEHVLPDEYRRLRDIAAARGDNQALVLFALMYIYCMRLGECLSLTQEDITFIRQGDKMIPVLILRKRKGSERWSSPKNIRECERKDYGSKKQAKRIIPITMDFYTSLARFLDKEIDDHKTKFPKKRHLLEADICDMNSFEFEANHYVFINHQRGGRLNDQAWNRKIRKYFVEAGLVVDTDTRELNLSHRLRHGGAMLYYRYLEKEKRLSLDDVRQMLGHKNIKTTLIYTKPTLADTCNIREQFQSELFEITKYVKK